MLNKQKPKPKNKKAANPKEFEPPFRIGDLVRHPKPFDNYTGIVVMMLRKNSQWEVWLDSSPGAGDGERVYCYAALPVPWAFNIESVHFLDAFPAKKLKLIKKSKLPSQVRRT